MRNVQKLTVVAVVAVLVYLGSLTPADALFRCPNGRVVGSAALCSGNAALIGSTGNPTWNDAAALFDAIFAAMSGQTEIGGVQYLAITGFDQSAITDLQAYFGVLAGVAPSSQQAQLLSQTFTPGNLNSLKPMGLTMSINFPLLQNANVTNANVTNFFAYNFSNPNTSNPNTAPSVPEPSTVILLGAGLAGLVGYRIRKKSKQN